MPELVGVEYYGTGTNAAKISSEGEVATTNSEKERNVFAAYGQSNIQATTYAILVDLSDTTHWKHDQTGRIDLSYISMQVDRAANSVGTLYVGIVTRVDATNGDISYIRTLQFQNNSETHLLRTDNFSPSQYKLGVVGGSFNSGIITNKESNISAVNTVTALNSPLGTATVIPAVGDMIIKYEHTSGSGWRGAAAVLYHGQATP